VNKEADPVRAAAEFGCIGESLVEMPNGFIRRTARDDLLAEDRYLAAEKAVRLPADRIDRLVVAADRRRHARQTGHADLHGIHSLQSSGSMNPTPSFVS